MPVLRQVAAELDERGARAGIRLAVEGDETLELPLRERMLRVVADNLAANAIRYAGHGSTFTFAVEREDGSVVLTAADDGVGVSTEHLPRLFERFYRADQARTSRGTGLGLAIVKHIVVAAGGEVEARGERGRGLRLRCVFPG
jgi:signal transduction histidine kinase